MPNEMTRITTSRSLKYCAVSALKRMIREDLDEAVKLGFLTKDEAVDEAIRTALEWKSN